MHKYLIKYLNEHISTPLRESEIELVKKTFAPKQFKRKQYLLQAGDVCKYFAFITKGAMRQYSVDDKGAEHTVGLFIERWWAGDRESFIMLTPSAYNVDAWEDTEALLVTKTDLANMIDQIPVLTEWIRKLDANAAIASQRRLNAAISLSAEERYHDLEETYPEFLQRFPQHIIASYLGITPETLSRVRGLSAKK